jgi:hypothetical protein
MEQYRRFMIPRDDTVPFSRVVENNARVLFQTVGAPFSWPANWIFAWRYGGSPDKYDLLVGRYLFYRQNNLGGLIDLGTDDGALIGDGWRNPERREGVWLRRTRAGSARIFVPLDIPRDLQVTLHASSRPKPLVVAVLINGAAQGRFLVSPGFQEYKLRVPARQWRRDINTMDLEISTGGLENYLLVDKVVFEIIEP